MMDNEISKNENLLENSFKALVVSSEDFEIANKLPNQCLQEKIISNLNRKNGDELDLAKNEFKLFLKLEKLNVSACNLFKIPKAVFSLRYLSDLNLSNNCLEMLPNEIKNLQNLVSLNLSHNKLIYLSNSLTHLHRLTYLNISHNELFEVPNFIYYSLRMLRIINLSFNVITHFDDPPECISNLTELKISDNKLERIPAWIFNSLCKLRMLDISGNEFNFNAIPVINYYNLNIFETLHSLNIENCCYNYERIEFLSHFKNLKVLHLGNRKETKGKNYLGCLKMNIFQNCNKLKSLAMQNVQISSLPLDFGSVKNIEILNLSENIISWLPDSFCNLINLKIVNLTSNQLLFLPDNIDKLVNLKEIHLGNNKLYELPASFYKLSNLEFVDLYNNQIERINPSIFLETKLNGIDLGLNCVDFNQIDGNGNAIREEYNRLKNYFRKHFDLLESRCDLQTIKENRSEDEVSFDSSSVNSSIAFYEDEESSFEDSLARVAQEGVMDDDLDNWTEVNTIKVEEDEFFDPNETDWSKQKPHLIKWSLHFQNNFCPANGDVRTLMNTLRRDTKSTSKIDTVEGQFDSD